MKKKKNKTGGEKPIKVEESPVLILNKNRNAMVHVKYD
jgi:hypothetical protein